MTDVDVDPGCTLNKKIRNAQLAQYNFILGECLCLSSVHLSPCRFLSRALSRVHLTPPTPQWWERKRRPATRLTCARATTRCTASARWTSACGASESCGAPAAATPRRNSESCPHCGCSWTMVDDGASSLLLLPSDHGGKKKFSSTAVSFLPLPVKFLFCFFYVTDKVLLLASIWLMRMSA